MSEKRALKADFKVEGADAPKFVGTAAAYNSPSQILTDKRFGAFMEIIKPGAFKRSLSSNQEIKADVNHEEDKVIGRRSKGTLILHDNTQGLNVEIQPPATTYAKDAIEAVRHGDYDGMSIQFKVNKDGERFYRDANGMLVRELSDLTLERVSIVAEPAYTDTSVELRSLREFVEAESKSPEQYQRQVRVLELS